MGRNSALVFLVITLSLLSTDISAQLPSEFDWRDYGKVTDPRSQYPFGTCWAHAAIADMESKVAIRENVLYDFSESNVVSCNLNFGGAFAGGIVKIAVNYLSVWGTVLESCDPYLGYLPAMVCRNDTCDYYKVLTEWQILPADRDAIKQAIMDYGPVQVKAETDTGWNSYDGTRCKNDCEDSYCLVNHNMLIVGWDDDHHCAFEDDGVWIIKNSAGVAWGDSGYVYISYGYNGVEYNSSLITDYKDWNPDENVYFWDEHGWTTETGYGDGIDWAGVEIESAGTEWLHAVNFWAVTGPLTYDLFIYEDNLSGAPVNLIMGPVSGTVDNAGFYTVDLPELIPMTAGDPVYIVMRFNGYGASAPIPIDDTGAMEAGKNYISNNGSSWEAIDYAGVALGDIGIRGRTTTQIERGDFGFYNTFFPSWVQGYPGQTISQSVRPANFATLVTTPCNGPDSVSVHAYDSQGWSMTGDPAFGAGTFLGAGDLSFQWINVTIPCWASPGMIDTVFIYTTYFEDGQSLGEHVDCTDPNWFLDDPYWSSDTLIIEVAELTQPFHIVEQPTVDIPVGQRPVSVKFEIINDDPCCGSPYGYIYTIESEGYIGESIDQYGVIAAVCGEETGITFAVLDTRYADICDYDSLTMIAMYMGDLSKRDTFVQVVHATEMTGDPDLPELPEQYTLEQNHPNPFNPNTEIRYSLPEGGRVLIEIFDVSGRRIVVLVDEHQEAGYRSIDWDGRSSDGSSVASGIYFYRMIAGDWIARRKMVLLR
ncbi:MAG: T9SS type A sorting domain-containing protein [Bacteroidales bacterium]|nr:T9SS type A sorting domain-containing protein [Candidatus Latescibacterota bacterium]